MDARSLRPDRGFWTQERTTELKERWLNQETASDICRAMGASSRDAIIGKAWRLGLVGTKANSPTKRREHGQFIPKIKQVLYMNGRFFKPPPPQAINETKAVFLKPKRFIVLRDNECHWPGDGQPGPDLLCCAEPIVPGRPYCVAHCRIAYVKSNPKPL